MIKVHLTRKNNPVSWILCVGMASRYSHCEIEIDGTCYGSVPLKGVYKHSVEDLISHYDVIESWEIKLSDDEKKFKDKLIHWLEAQIGAGYDYLPALALGFLRRNWQEDQRKWFCSELVDAACKAADLPLTNQYFLPYRVTPNDLRSSIRLDLKSLIKNKG
ncbi:hypothetical protein L3V86_03500 [Thiotrichales bacterium 19S11-10]|nr:hypothetical protein [Thiotrichales bacterium 19S11-10]